MNINPNAELVDADAMAEHGSYGAFYKDTTNAPKATKITFD